MQDMTIHFSRVLSGPKKDQSIRVSGATFPLLSLPGYSCDGLAFRWSDSPVCPGPMHSSRTTCSDALHQQEETQAWFLGMQETKGRCADKTNLQDVVL